MANTSSSQEVLQGGGGVCYPENMEFPREIVKRCVVVPGGGEVPALPSGYRLDPCGMAHDEQSETTRVWFRSGLEGYPLESYGARAIWQALVMYGERVVQLESRVDGGEVHVVVTVGW